MSMRHRFKYNLFFEESRYICVQSSTKQFPSSKRQKEIGKWEMGKNFTNHSMILKVSLAWGPQMKKRKVVLIFYTKMK